MSTYTRRLVKETENVIKNSPSLSQEIANNANNPDELAKLIKKAIDEASKKVEPWTNDKWVYRMAIFVLGLLALLAAYAAYQVTFTNPQVAVPESLVALGSAAAGALVGLFAKPPSSDTSGE